MNDVRTLLFPVLVDVVHIVAIRQEHIQLDRDHRIFLAVNVLGLNVKLGTVEGRFAGRFRIVQSDLIEDLAHSTFDLVPLLGRAQILVGILGIPLGEPIGHILLQSQRRQTVLGQPHAVLEFLIDLLGRADQMALGDRELPHTRQTVHLAGILVSEKRRRLAHPIGKIPVALLRSLVDIVLERTGHGTQRIDIRIGIMLDHGNILHAVNFSLRVSRIVQILLALVAEGEHAVLVMVPVIGDFIERGLGHQRCPRTYIPPFIVFQILDPALQFLNDLCSFRQEQRQALADDIDGRKEPHLPAQPVVVALVYALQILQILFQIRLLRIRGAVDPGQHLVVLITPPVSA